MASSYLQKYQLPEGFQDFLSELVRETLRAQPEDMIEFLANYCEARANGKTYDYDSIFVKENQQRQRVIDQEPPKQHYNDITNRAKLLVQQSNQQPVQLKPIIKDTRTSVMDDIPDPQGWESHKEAYAEQQKKKEYEIKKINYQQHEMYPSNEQQNKNHRTSAYQKLKEQMMKEEQEQQDQENNQNSHQNYNQNYDQSQQTEENQYIQYNNNNNNNNNNYNQQQYQQYQFRQKEDSNLDIYHSEKTQSRQQSAASQGQVSNTTSHPEEKGVSRQFMGDLYNSALNKIHSGQKSHEQEGNQEYQEAADYIDNRYNQLQEQQEDEYDENQQE